MLKEAKYCIHLSYKRQLNYTDALCNKIKYNIMIYVIPYGEIIPGLKYVTEKLYYYFT